MSAGNEGTGGNTSYELTLFEKNALAEAQTFTARCENQIAVAKKDFSGYASFWLWWDAKGLFNCSDKEIVMAHMERYRQLYEEINTFTEQVEKNDPKSYGKLLDLYKKIEEAEKDAKRDATNNRSSAVCRMLREFLDQKFKLDHSLKKVECIVLQQKMSHVEQTCQSAKESVNMMTEKMDQLIRENRAVRQESDEKLKQVLEEAEERSAARIREMKKENDDLRLEARARSEAVRQESDEKLKQVLEEAEKRSAARIREMKKENDELRSEAQARSEAARQESDEKLKQVLEESKERSEALIQEMKNENEELRAEAERLRQESVEMVKEAVEEANRKSEARMQAMTEQNRASLQKMTKLLEAMNL